MKLKKIGCLALLFILSVTILTGCMKADSARHDDIYALFKTSVENELYVNATNVGSAIISEKDSDNYYFEFTPNDNLALRNTINSQEKNNFNMLANRREYGYLLSHSSKYFFNKFNDRAMLVYSNEKLSAISQEKLTSLYYQVEEVVKNIKDFGFNYRKLSHSFNELDKDSKSTKYALEELLIQYKSLISSVLKMNMTTESIIDDDLFVYENSKSSVSLLELNRLVDAFELYVTNYLYQKYMFLTNDVQVEFLKTSSLINKLDELLKVLEQFKNNTSFKCLKVDEYEYLRLVEKDVRNQLIVNENALNVLEGELPSQQDEYKTKLYNQLVAYENNLENYLDRIIELFK